MSVDKSYVMAQLGKLHENRDEGDFSITCSNGEVIKAHPLILSMRCVHREIENWHVFRMCLSQV